MSAYIPVELRLLVRLDAKGLCGYCRSAEALMGIPLEFEHLHPESLGGKTERLNLWMACYSCNRFKGNRIVAIDPQTLQTVSFFNPRTQIWHEHFQWSQSGTRIHGITAIGRATIDALQMNNDYIVEARHFWLMSGRHPPTA